jgi:hypothetical protein
MVLRGHFGIALAVAVGISLGYAVRPAAQGASVAASPQATSEPYLFSIEAGEQGRIRITMPDPITTTRVVEDTKFRVMFTNDLLILQPLNRDGAIVQPELDHRPSGFAFRVPK